MKTLDKIFMALGFIGVAVSWVAHILFRESKKYDMKIRGDK